MTQPTRIAKGFTLIELMIVVGIIAILAAIAYPSYINHVVDTRRSTAAACLLEQAQFMEREYTSELTYAAGNPIGRFACETQDLTGFYGFRFSAGPTATTYTLEAAPQGAQLRDAECGILTIDEDGTRTQSGTGTVADCW